MKIAADFVISAASAADFPQAALPEVVLVGRSNVGKSSLINALVRQKLARTSGEPGKTRLANVYRIARPSAGAGRSAGALHLIDLPGYGYARKTKQGAEPGPAFDAIADAAFARQPAALLLVDSRHPGLDSDRAAWAWMCGVVDRTAVVATKIDKLARGERIRAMRQLESVFDTSPLAVSARTGEGLEALWNLIDSLAKPPSSRPRTNPTGPAPLPKK